MKLKQGLQVFLLLAFITIWFCASAQRNVSHKSVTYCVSTRGNDITGNGTAEKPWLSLSHAFAYQDLHPNDIVQLGEGVFVLDEPIVIPKGVTLKGVRNKTILTGINYFSITENDFNHYANLFLLQLPLANNQIIADLILDGHGRKLHGGLWIGEAAFLTITNVELRNFNWCGMWLVQSNQCEISNCTFLNNAYQHPNNCTGNLQLWNAENLKMHHLFFKEERWAYAIKTYSPDWLKKEWWETPHGHLSNVEIFQCHLDVPELGGWAVPGTNIHAPDITIELQGVDLNSVNIHHNWMNNHISAVLGRWGKTGQTLHIHHNIFDIHPWGYSIELNQDYVEVDHNIFRGGQHPFAQWQQNRTNKCLNIHDNYFMGLNTKAGYNALLRWVGGVDTLLFQNNTFISNLAPKNPLFLSTRENGFLHTRIKNNLFLNFSDTTNTPVFYRKMDGADLTNVGMGFTDDQATRIVKRDIKRLHSSDFELWKLKSKAIRHLKKKVESGQNRFGPRNFKKPYSRSGPDPAWQEAMIRKYHAIRK